MPFDYRKELINEVLPYIQSSNAGLDDELYGVIYAACYDNDDLHRLTAAFEAMKQDWPIDHARRIYRKIGEKDKYLELRKLKMEVGADYYDLATFYWDEGKKEEAINIAEKGLTQGEGRLDEVRFFLAERARETGDRKRYLELHFEQTIDQLTLEKYKAFKKMCSTEEWTDYETAILNNINRTWDDEKLKIYMHRKEYDKALAVLIKKGYPYLGYDDDYEKRAAANLEKRFPEQILKYYRSGLGNLNRPTNRNSYARKALVMKKVRHMYVDIIKTPEKWMEFARQVKQDNVRRPAFQEEFTKVVPGWNDIK